MADPMGTVAFLVSDKLKHKVFTNNQEGVVELLTWLKKHGIDLAHVCLEASTTYSDELATLVYDAGQSVSIVNPTWIKGLAQSELLRTKTDTVDAGIIAISVLQYDPSLGPRFHPNSENSKHWRGGVDPLSACGHMNSTASRPRARPLPPPYGNISRTWTERSRCSKRKYPTASIMTRTSGQKESGF